MAMLDNGVAWFIVGRAVVQPTVVAVLIVESATERESE